MNWPVIDMEEMIINGLIKLGRGKVISKLDIAACPGPFPIYSSAQMNNGKFGEYGKYMFDQELITWSVDGGGQLFYRPKHKFSVTNVAGTLEILDSSQLDCKYLHYVLSDKHSRLKFDWIQKAHPSVIRRLYKEIPLPPLDDQKRIARLLGKVDGLIARRKQHLQQLDDLLKSVFLEMFGDPVRNEKGWDTVPFHKVGKFVSGGTPSKGRDDFWNGEFPWVSPKDMKVTKIDDAIDHISETVFEETALKRIAPDHLLIVVRGMILAHSFPVAINTVDIAINQDMKAIKPAKGLNVVYLLNCLTSLKRQILKLISTAGHGTRKFDSIAMHKLFIPKPPEDLQNQFAEIVEKVEGIKSRYQQSLTDLESLYGALSQKAFKGELELSRVPLPVEATTENTDRTETHRKTKPLPRGFARQLLAAEILHCHNNHGMTQMKLQKLIHLAEYHARLDEIQGEYQRQAAGPFDNKMMYGIAAGLKKQQWFEMHGRGQSATYSPLLKAGGHEKYLLRWQDKMAKIDEMMQLLGKARPDQCEIVSTLYAAWNDLLIDGAEITDEGIVEQASKAKLWHKTKEAIDPDRWPKALQWMRDHNLVPTGYGKHTRKLK